LVENAAIPFLDSIAGLKNAVNPSMWAGSDPFAFLATRLRLNTR
jgi:hypothetical protein